MKLHPEYVEKSRQRNQRIEQLARIARLENDKDQLAVEVEIEEQNRRYRELLRTQVTNQTIGK
jgi:hypothetical protein